MRKAAVAIVVRHTLRQRTSFRAVGSRQGQGNTLTTAFRCAANVTPSSITVGLTFSPCSPEQNKQWPCPLSDWPRPTNELPMNDSDRHILIAVVSEAQEQLAEIEDALRENDEERIAKSVEGFVTLRHSAADWLGTND